MASTVTGIIVTFTLMPAAVGNELGADTVSVGRWLSEGLATAYDA